MGRVFNEPAISSKKKKARYGGLLCMLHYKTSSTWSNRKVFLPCIGKERMCMFQDICNVDLYRFFSSMFVAPLSLDLGLRIYYYLIFDAASTHFFVIYYPKRYYKMETAQ